MIYVNDQFYEKSYFEQCYVKFKQHEILGACKGKRLTVAIEDTAIWIALCLYAREEGISVFPLPVGTPMHAMKRRAKLSASHYMITGKSLEEVLSSIELVSQHPDDKNAVLVQMSSGTTGEPKCIERSWSSIDLETRSYINHFTDLQEMIPVVACPVNHSYGLICGVLVSLARGCEPRIVTNFNPKYIIRKIEETENPILYSSPALITTITMMIKGEQSVHAIMTSGTLMQDTWLKNVLQKVGTLYQQYGCSEVGCISLGKEPNTVHDMGFPLPHILVTAGSSDQSLDEIIVTNEKMQKVPTRDLGYICSKGRLHFIARIDEMINVSGLNVYPAEVEKIIMEMPGIDDAVVFKGSHSFGNDQVCMQFVASLDISDDEIRSWCRPFLNTYQIPIKIDQVQRIERLPNGKVSRKKLAESIA